MTTATPIYDLVLLLNPDAEEEARTKIVADARAAIDADGETVRADSWGERQLAYPIDKRKSAEYHLLQFHAGSAALLEELGRTLRIDDDVLRFRIIKLAPGVPDAPPMAAAPVEREPEAAPAEASATEAPAAEAPAADASAADAPAAEAPAAEAAVAEAPVAEAPETAGAEAPVEPAEGEPASAEEPADA